MTSRAVSSAASAAGKSREIFETLSSPNSITESPQTRYPPAMNPRRRPRRSDSAPISRVVRVAVTALAATMSVITPASARMVL